MFGSSSADLQEYYFLLIFVYSEVKGKEQFFLKPRSAQTLAWHYDLCNCREHVAEYGAHPRNTGLLILP